ncbi:uncharacterized protein [Acropora muricata]|uniref:uncharacterized protein isoform X3 n=1 Tax=Acropora muricata TaxID=159855 RepID=UPI0034E48D71
MAPPNTKRKKKPGTGNATNSSASNFTESAMDEFLSYLNLYRKPIAKDGSCLFRAVSEQVYHCQAQHLQVRKDCIDFMRQNREKFEAFLEGPFDHHLFRLQNPKEWAGQVEISALSLMYEKDFIVYQEINVEPTKVTDNNFKDKILLCYSNGNHYDAVYDNQFQKDAAFCQSLVYGILYQKVFAELDKRENSAKSSKSNPPADITSPIVFYQNGLREEDSFKDEAEDNSGWTEVKSRSSKAKSARQNKGHEQEDLKEEASKPYLDQKHGWQARRSLDPEYYRNVELEVWEDSKNGQEQQDRNYAASIQYQCGDKCFAYVGPPEGEDKVYEAIVVYYLPVQGNIEVRIPELQQRSYVIPLQNLKPSGPQGNPDQNYRELSGFYKKSEGVREDGKRGGRKKHMSGRPPRGSKGDEQADDGSARKGFQDESYSRPRPGAGMRDKSGRGRGRGRYPRGGRDERQTQKDEEEARMLAAEQAKLAELQEKDPAAFPALPTQQAEEKPQTVSSVETAQDQTPALFWSRLNSNPPIPSTAPPKEPNQASVAPDDKSPPGTSATVNHQSNTAKVDAKEQETRKERLPTRENVEAGNKASEPTKKNDFESVEASNISLASERRKLELNGVSKPAIAAEKDQAKNKREVVKEVTTKQPVKDLSSGIKTLQKSNVEAVRSADVVEGRWPKETSERSEPKIQANDVKEFEANDKKREESPVTSKQAVRGVIRMKNLNNKLSGTPEAEEQSEANKDEVKSMRKAEDTPSLKPALVGAEHPQFSAPEKKTVTFAEPLNEGGEIEMFVHNSKDLAAGKDRKSDIYAPSTLVSVVMKPAPTAEVIQENSSVSILAPNKSASEDEASTTKNPIPSAQTTKLLDSDSPPEETNQTTEGSQPAPSISPVVFQPQASYQALPSLPVMFMQLPNMTNHPRLPSGMSCESDGSDLPDDPNTLRYFFNLGFQYHMQMQMSQQIASQQMLYFPQQAFPMQEHLQPHPAATMGQQLSQGVSQVVYPSQQMQGYHPPQGPQVMQENASFSDRNSLDRSSPGQTQGQHQQQQQQQQQGMSMHQPHLYPNQRFWRPPRVGGYQGKQVPMHPQVQNQPTSRGLLHYGSGGNPPRYKTKKNFPKHRNDQYHNAQSPHAQLQTPLVHGAHAYSNASQTAGSSSNSFFLAGGDHSVGKGTGDFYHGNQQYVNYAGGASPSMPAPGASHSSGANIRSQYQ